ncbi:MAG: hypothetical protein R6V04_03255 [bacterium]
MFSQNFNKIILKEVLSIGSIDSEILYQWADICTDDSGNIYLTDMMDYSIKKFTPEGEFIKKTGRSGQGPGEFNAIRFIKYYNNHLYVTDQYRPGIQVFDTNLQYRYSIPFLKPIADIQILSHNRIAIPDVIEGNIQIIDSLGNKNEIFYYKKNQKRKNSDNLGFFPNMIEFEFDNQNNLYMCYTAKNKIKQCNKKGKTIWSVTFFKNKKQEYNNSYGLKTPEYFYYKDLALDTSMNIFILGGNLSKNKSRDVYILSQNGEHITTLTLPDETHCIYIDKENYLYSRAKQGIILKKYKMIYN